MPCPHCCSNRITQLQRTTNLGYAVFYCRDCHRTFNERTGTPFNFLEFPTDIVFQVLLCRLRYKLSYRDVAEFFLVRGFEFTHETVRDWEERFAPIFADELRAKRKGKVGKVEIVRTGSSNLTFVAESHLSPFFSPLSCFKYLLQRTNSL